MSERPWTDAEPSTAACPRCGEGLGALPAVGTSALGGIFIRRCSRCGTRSTAGPQSSRLMYNCESCGLPFLVGELLPRIGQRCEDCRDGRPPAGLPDPLVVAATEAEVRAALARRWRFVRSAPLGDYLERLTRSVARKVEGAPAGSRAVLVEEATLRTLALPSGMLLITVGTLGFLEDEAELAFVLGHELAHAASGDAAVQLVRMGFDAVARDQEDLEPLAWAEAALDLVKLGYGRPRERDADARALEALLGLRYDPESALAYLRRLQKRMERGDPAVAEVAAAHPPPADRIRRIERILWGRVKEDSLLRVNREVFRRAVVRELSNGRLERMDLVDAGSESAAIPSVEKPPRLARLVRIGIVLAALAAAVTTGAWLLLSR